jgi:hypothetical protein
VERGKHIPLAASQAASAFAKALARQASVRHYLYFMGTELKDFPRPFRAHKLFERFSGDVIPG